MGRTLAEQAYEYIRAQLAHGELPPGERLVNRVLAEEIGVSVIPVREAIHRLASEGLVEHIPGSGAFVRQIDIQQLDHLYVLRDALESCAAGEAARYISDEQLGALDGSLQRAREIQKCISEGSTGHATRKQLDAWLDAEMQFHELLIEAARNPLLAKVIHEHQAIGQIFDAQRQNPRLLTDEVASQTWKGKAALIRVLKQRDATAARELMSQQIQRGRKQVLQHLRQAGSHATR